MALKRSSKRKNRRRDDLTGISVEGYKSLVNECTLEIRPLTILAGSNSSGKSSAIQPLLLMKQTLEATYDPGPLMINGPNARFNSSSQLLSKVAGQDPKKQFTIKLEVDERATLGTVFGTKPRQGLNVLEMTYQNGQEEITLRPDMSPKEVTSVVPKQLLELMKKEEEIMPEWQVERTRCFLALSPISGTGTFPSFLYTPASIFDKHLRSLIHVPGLRGNPARDYPTTAVGAEFPGTFENYVASIVNQWQDKSDERLTELGSALETLGLTWKVEARPINDTQVELRVGRVLHSRRGGAHDLVNIADVGFGVSQSLPVLIALLVAKPGQIVYLEQPEIHLHPCGQVALARLLAEAANRGVRVIAETHSSLLLLAIQTLVANEEFDLAPDLVKLHWFERDAEGVTQVSSTDLDEAGAFGDWPENFDDVTLKAQSQYLDAAETALQARAG